MHVLVRDEVLLVGVARKSEALMIFAMREAEGEGDTIVVSMILVRG